MAGIEKVYDFLNEAGAYYLATVEGDQPRVRPFGTMLLYDGKLYIQTGKVKNVSKQISANPKVEICAFKDGKWVRVTGILENDDNRDVKVAMLEKMPHLGGMYSPDDGNMQMLYFKCGKATFSSFTEAPEEIEFYGRAYAFIIGTVVLAPVMKHGQNNRPYVFLGHNNVLLSRVNMHDIFGISEH